MYQTNHTLILAGATVLPGQTLTAKQLDGCDVKRLLELGAISKGAIDAEVVADPYAGMTEKQRKAAEKKAAAEKAADGAEAPTDDGLDG